MRHSLPPERFHRLQVRLDHVRRSTESCRKALTDLADGTVSRAEFERILAEHQGAHRAWMLEARADRIEV